MSMPTARLAQLVIDTSTSALPDALLDAARGAVMDTLSVGLAGVAEPVSFLVEAEGVSRSRSAEIVDALRREFDLTPAGIIRSLDLQRPIYYPTAAYGHFGRDDLDLPWESIRQVVGAGSSGEPVAA